ncbi:sensor domain-containing diguanylate cyclase [Sutcliffiella halmapala]|uniref:sensor domain-containing diguanylate cyclase n=1 Tax=Sutcliffiella halmapala TaxID=79882 RepID=UPI000994B489|nr:diguanylate cyclase [Sutcliffiella halmapala]
MKVTSHNFLILFFFFLVLFLTAPPSTSASTNHIVLPKEFAELSVTNQLEIYIDKNSNISNDEILSNRENFLPLQEANVSGDLSDVTYWIKLPLVNSATFDREVLLELKKPHLSSVELYSVKNDALHLEETIGYRYPFKVRMIEHRNMVFPLQLLPEQTEIFYLKIKTDSFFQAPISIWEPIAFASANYTAQTFFGLFYGIMIAMIIYNSFLFLSLKEKTYLYYILFIVGFTVLQFIWDGFAFQWLWGDFPWFALRSNSFFIIWSSLFSLQFANHFLQLKNCAPILHKLTNVFIVTSSLLLAMPFILSIKTATMISMLVASLFIILIIAIALKVRLYTREAKFFIIAWSLLLIGVILNLLAGYKLIPLTPLSLYAPKIGALVVVLVLSLGLADRIKRITLEKEQESRKYYIQTLLQSSFNQLAKVNTWDSLVKCALESLISMTKYEKGFYLTYENERWELITKTDEQITINQPISIHEKFLEKTLTIKDIDPTIFGIQSKSQSFFSIPILTAQHTGMFVIYSEEKNELPTFEANIIIPTFTEQLTLLINNLFNYQSLKESAMYDHLTRVCNRKYFMEEATEILSQTAKSNHPSSLLLIDIDHFKRVNDTYGHTVGDQALTFVAQKISTVCNEKGIVGRFGGEEFIVILPNTTYTQASLIANKLIEAHHFHPFILNSGKPLWLTISIGVCSNQQKNLSLQEMIQYADEALYQAKEKGRDQVVLYS